MKQNKIKLSEREMKFT